MERADYEHWSAKEVARLLALVETGRRYYQEIVAVAPTGLLVVSADLSVVMANRRFREIFNLRGQDLSKRTLEEVLPVDGFRKRIMDVLTNGEGQHAIAAELPGEEEETRSFRLDLEFMETWEEDKDPEVLVFVHDVTPYARPTPVVKQQELPEIPAIFWEADCEKLQFTFVSEAAACLLGFPADRWTTEENLFPDRIHPDDRLWVLGLYRGAAEDGADRRCEYRGLAANGALVWLRELIHPVRGEDGRVTKLTGVILDNTEHRQLYEQSIEAAKMEALTRLASRVGHDFNNLLMIVAGYGEELRNGLPARDPLRAEVDEILGATERVSHLTNHLLSFSRRLAARPQTIDLTRLLQDLAPRLRAALPANVKLETVLGSESVQVEADPALIEQAVSDLAGCTQGLMADGGTLTIEASGIRLGEHGVAGPSMKPGDYALISISGSGAALDEDTRRTLFEPFAGPREFGKGPGLGLANTYRIVKQAGGDIWAASEPGQASLRVYLPRLATKLQSIVEDVVSAAPVPEPVQAIAPPPPAAPEPVIAAEPAEAAVPETEAAEIPVAPAAEAEAGVAAAESLAAPAGEGVTEEPSEAAAPPKVEAEPAAPVPSAAGHETVLVVEDEEGVRALMYKILHRQGYTVIQACNGAEALDVARSHRQPIHLLVTDVVMPQMGGRALAEQLKGIRPDIKVLYVSGFTDDAVIQSGLLPPGTAFLQKPFTLNSLLTKVREVLNGRQSLVAVQ